MVPNCGCRWVSTIIGDSMMSQLLTLYTTLVVYLYMDRFRLWSKDKWDHRGGRVAPDAAEA